MATTRRVITIEYTVPAVRRSPLLPILLIVLIDGITAGNLSLAQAYISDHTKPENRAKSFGIIGIAFGLGFMVGPGFGGWLADYQLTFLPSASLPFVVAGALSLLSMVATSVLL